MRGAELTAGRLRELLDYDPETGIFLWRKPQSRAMHIGEVAGVVKSNGRRYISVSGQVYLAHRLAWLYVKGEWPVGYVRHRNERFDDNRFANLYETSPTGTNIDRRLGKNNTSGRVGVGFNTRRQRWKAWIKRDFRSVHLGWFDSFEEACAARSAAETHFPANVSGVEFERSQHHERTRRRARVAWNLLNEKYPSDVAWTNLGAFIADVGEPPGARYTIEKMDVTEPVGPENYQWLAPPSVRYDMKTAAGRAARSREIYRETTEKQRRWGLKSRYGLTDEQIDSIIEREKGPCDICARLERVSKNGEEPRLGLDHDHINDFPRGLLCGTCNSALGFLGDSIAMLIEAAIYKAKYPRPGEFEEARARLPRLLEILESPPDFSWSEPDSARNPG